jgi:hypothetical protein
MISRISSFNFGFGLLSPILPLVQNKCNKDIVSWRNSLAHGFCFNSAKLAPNNNNDTTSLFVVSMRSRLKRE